MLKATIQEPATGLVPLVVGESRPLTDADMKMLELGRAVQPSSLTQIRARHHALARALAQGMRPGIAAATYGYSVSRVSVLQGDPTFAELVEHYRREEGFDAAKVNERLTAITVEAIDVVVKRLEEEPEKIDMKDLHKLIALGADRTGFGPKSTKEVDVNVGFGAKLQAAQARLEKATKMIEGEVAKDDADD